MSASSPIRVLVAGTGSIGQRHIANIAALYPDARFVLLQRTPRPVAGIDGVSVGSLAQALELMPQAAIVATPSASHAEILPGLIAAGIPCYVEKPVVTANDQADAVADALATRPDPGHVAGFNLRLLASLAKARRFIADGGIGEVVRASFAAGQWLPDWRKGRDYKQSYSSRKDAGGGVVFDLSHEIDAARWLLGDIDVLACQFARSKRLDIDAEAAASLLARSHAGAAVSINLDYVARQPIRRYEVVGDAGTLVWDLRLRQLVVHGPDGVSTALTENADDFDVVATYPAAMKSFLATALSGEAASLQSLEDGLASTRLAILANRIGRYN